MIAFGYQQSNTDHTIFIKHYTDNITIIIVYVDDIVVTGNNQEEMTSLKHYLAKEFEIKDSDSL